MIQKTHTKKHKINHSKKCFVEKKKNEIAIQNGICVDVSFHPIIVYYRMIKYHV